VRRRSDLPDGHSADVGDIQLRNVHVVYPTSEEYSITSGGTVELGFTAINSNTSVADELTGISSPEARVTIVDEAEAGSNEIAPLTALGAGSPADVQLDDPLLPIQLIKVEMADISENVRPGLTLPVTFEFANAGEVVVNVPVDAGIELERDPSAVTEHSEGE
jgi:copper(I)-binding protein